MVYEFYLNIVVIKKGKKCSTSTLLNQGRDDFKAS